MIDKAARRIFTEQSNDRMARSLANTQARIEAQRAIVHTLRPGSAAHRTAVEVLLFFEDSLHELTEARDLLRQLNQMKN